MSTEFSDASMRTDGSVTDVAHSGVDPGKRRAGIGRGLTHVEIGSLDRVERESVAKRRATRDGVDGPLDASTLLDLVVELQRDNEQLCKENRRLERENSQLARQLERRGRERQYVLDHYEDRLREANRELEGEPDESGAETRPGQVVDALVSRVTPD
jgi:hypothetical protein